MTIHRTGLKAFPGHQCLKILNVFSRYLREFSLAPQGHDAPVYHFITMGMA
jgi:hypothetical protein